MVVTVCEKMATEQDIFVPLRPHRRRWLVVVALGALAAGLLVEVGRSLAEGEAPLPQASARPAGSIIAVTGQISRDGYGVYLVDLDNETICVYQYHTSAKTLRLLASRMFTYDMQLNEYNTEPSPREIMQLVTQHRQLGDKPARLPGPPVPTGDGEVTTPQENDAPTGE